MDSIQPIKHIKAISFREELLTSGNSPIKVIGSDFNMYVVKNSKGNLPATDIINEVLVHYFLKLWDIPTPDIAIVSIDSTHLLEEYRQQFHKERFYKNEVFGSRWLNNAVDSNRFFEINDKRTYSKFNNPEIIFKIGLFDIWVENDNRKPSNQNLLFETINGKQNIIPIDHSYIFGTQNYKELNPTSFAPMANENIFVASLALSLKQYRKKNKKWLNIDKEKFYLCIQKCQENYVNIVRNIPESWGFSEIQQQKVHDFLFNEARNKAIFEDYLQKLS